MHENWKKASQQALRFGFYKHFLQNSAINDDGLVSYSPIDFKDPESVPSSLANFDFITVCWALNEAVFNEEFWKKVVELTPKAFIIFVEGVDDQLVKISEIAKKANRKILFERFESPRRLIIHPTENQGAPAEANQEAPQE